MQGKNRRLVRWDARHSTSMVRISVLLCVCAGAQRNELTGCRIEIVSPQTGEVFEEDSGVLLELGLIDCPVRSLLLQTPFPQLVISLNS